ncbi:MAG TPA: DUF1854 domain-containing protein [Longimicrobiales bacterium]|nr:DUF1854 domain-containing protein [Longimicrobiales bacterium]
MVQFRTHTTEREAPPNGAGRPGANAGGEASPEPGRRNDEALARGRPGGLRLERRRDGQLWAIRGEEEKAVRVRRLFPWSEEDRHVSLRDATNREFALVGPEDDLDVGSLEALDEAMLAAGFVLEVRTVLDIDEEIEIRVWRVETSQGPRTFQTHLDDWPRDVPGGGLLIRDVAGDLYHVAEPDAMDRRSRELLWAFTG